MTSPRVRAALELARAAARAPFAPPVDAPAPVARRVAVGDPQAPIETFLAILDAHDLLGDDGWLAPGVQLVALGDYFDWGRRDDRARAAASALALLAWLAAHPPARAVLIAGNHDLARVGELAALDDAAFEAARAEADAAYHDARPRRPEAEFCAAYGLPTWEVAARDLGTFRAEQRALVAALLRAGRLRVAHAAAPDLLVCHAGVTVDELAALGVPEPAWTDAAAIARALDAALAAAVAAWRDGTPLAIPALHAPGDARGEGRGMFYHRAAVARSDPAAGGIPRRRFPPSRLPRGLTQAIGHVRDKKSREMLGVTAEESRDGPLRYLRVAGDGAMAYGFGAEVAARDAATVIHLDGGMLHADPAAYELLDLDARRAAARRDPRA